VGVNPYARLTSALAPASVSGIRCFTMIGVNSRKILSKDVLEKLKRVESFPGNCAVN